MLPAGEIRRNFLPRDDEIYFNAGVVGFPARSVAEETQRIYAELRFQPESRFFAGMDRVHQRWQEILPRLISCKASELIGVPNTTAALNLVAHAIPWQAGDNAVITDLAFTNEYLPFQHAQSKYGYEVRVARRHGWQMPAEAVERLIDKQTRLVVLSHVTFANGFRLDVKRIAQAAHAHGAYLAIDAIQSLGPLVVDVRDLDVDFLAAGSSKWLMAYPGWGILFVREAVLPELREPVAGFLGLEDPMQAVDNWTNSTEFVRPYKISRTRIDKFRTSTENLLAKISLTASAAYFLRLGTAAIESHVLDLSGYLTEQLAEHGHQLRSSHQRAHRSGIVSFLPRQPVPELQQRLEAERIFISVRGGAIRVCLHLYNTRAEIDRLVEALERICETGGNNPRR